MEKKIWWKESVVYQIYPRSFMDGNGDGIGDLKGITSKLDYLKELGVDVLWISPIFKSPNVDMGYDISDYQDIMEDFGTMEDFDILLQEAHDRGLKIVMDLVVNHSSDQHKWFIESKKSKDNPYRDYYVWKDGKDGREPTNWGSYFSGSAWTYDETTGMYYLHQFAVEQPDLNWENEKVRQSIFEMMTWWCDKGIDGFRMDVINLISKDTSYPDYPKKEEELYANVGEYVSNGPRVHEFLQDMNKKVLSKYDLITVGETPNVTPEDAQKYAGFDANELHMVFQFEHMGIDGGAYGKWTDRKMYLPDLKKILSKWQTELEGSAWNSLYWNNHDQPRIVSRWGNDTAQYREISAKMLGTCLHMMKGTPYVYQGEELGMTNVQIDRLEDFRDVEILNAYRELVEENHIFEKEELMRYFNLKGRDNARTPMQWNEEKNGGFTTGEPWIVVNPNYVTINAEAQVKDENSIFHYYKKLIQLRKENEVIVYGKYELLEADSEELFVFTREWNGKKLLIVCNFTDNEIDYKIPEEFRDGPILIQNYEKTEKVDSFRPYEARVLSCTC